MKLIEFGSISHITKGKKPVNQSKERLDGFKPYVDIEAFETGKIKAFTDGEKCLPCKNGDILIVCDGSRSGFVGRAIEGYVGSTLAIISADGMTSDYLYYFLQGKYALLNTKKKGTGTPHLDANILNQQKLIVPSVTEQEHIVAKMEELFSELDNGVETLKKTKLQLEVYRQSVLKQAFETYADMVEISYIVEDIRIGPFGTALHKEDYIVNGIPVINPQHIKHNAICASNKITVSTEKAKELNSYRLKENDVIMGRRGEMGRTAAVTSKETGWICGTGSIRFRLKEEYDAGFYAQILSSPRVVHYLEENATGTTMKNLNEEIVKHIPVPRITRKQQEAIQSKLDAALSVCDNLEKTVNIALQQAEAMRQSILKKAFEGAL